MENILDFEGKPKGKGNWKPVLITNAILSLLFVVVIIVYTLLNSPIIGLPLSQKIYFSLFFIAVFIVVINLLLSPLSLFFSKNYWKKWLIMAVFGVILFVFTLVFQVITDISKLL